MEHEGVYIVLYLDCKNVNLIKNDVLMVKWNVQAYKLQNYCLGFCVSIEQMKETFIFFRNTRAILLWRF